MYINIKCLLGVETGIYFILTFHTIKSRFIIYLKLQTKKQLNLTQDNTPEV